MSVGTINSPASWSLGTVLAPSWAQNVQDNINFLFGGSPTGAAANAMSLTGVSGSDLPLISFKDSAGNIRSIVDHNAYQTSRNVVIDENWVYNLGTISSSATPISAAQRWNANIIGASSQIVWNAPTAAYPQPWMTLTIVATNSTQAVLYSAGQAIHTGANWLSCIIEFEVGVSALGANSRFYVGLSDTPTAVYSSGGNYIYLASGATNWNAFAQTGGVNSNADTGVAVSTGSNPLQRIKLEYHQSASPLGLRVRASVNESSFAAVTTNIPSNQLMYLTIANTTSGAASSASSMYVGPIRMVFNRQLSEPNL